MKDDSLFAFAGIWDRWKPRTGPLVESCDRDNGSERTPERRTRPDAGDSSARALLHVAQCSDLSIWTAADTLLPYDAGAMRRFPVSDCVNVPANENPDCLIETAELIPAQHTLFH